MPDSFRSLQDIISFYSFASNRQRPREAAPGLKFLGLLPQSLLGFNPVHAQVSALLTGILQGHSRDIALFQPSDSPHCDTY